MTIPAPAEAFDGGRPGAGKCWIADRAVLLPRFQCSLAYVGAAGQLQSRWRAECNRDWYKSYGKLIRCWLKPSISQSGPFYE